MTIESVPQALSPELNHSKYEEAMRDYAARRARQIRETTYAQGTEWEVGTADMRRSLSLLEDIPGDSERQDVESMCTVCMPVAILHEDPELVRRSVELVGSNQVPEGSNIELILWTNAKYHEANEEKTRREAAQKYQALRDSLGQLDTSRLKVRTALQLLPQGQFSMSRLRRHYMDAVTLDVFERHPDFDYPVVWLDADTTHMSTTALETLSREVRNHEALFIHPNLRFNLDWATGKPMSELDDAEKAVAIHEIHRRQTEREMNEYEVLGYLEEHGLAFSVGTYLSSGGVRIEGPMNESAEMVYNDRTADFLERDETTTWPFKRASSAHIGSSARRQYEMAKVHGAEGLTRYGGHLFIDSPKVRASPRITSENMRELLSKSDDKYKDDVERSGVRDPERRKKSQKVAKRLIDRYFENSRKHLP